MLSLDFGNESLYPTAVIVAVSITNEEVVLVVSQNMPRITSC